MKINCGEFKCMLENPRATTRERESERERERDTNKIKLMNQER